jgi:sulfur carrier protein
VSAPAGEAVPLRVNGRAVELPSGLSVSEVLARLGYPSRGVAVALDGEVVPRSAWDTTVVGPGAALEVLHPVQGG